jgi:type IV pilus secretin PilQ/predicted competence protein
MQRWHVMAFCLILAIVGPMGCALNTSPGDQARTPQTFTAASAFLTAVDVDVLDDHTLITLQSDAPLRYSVRHDETPSRLIIDLPAHKIAPGVRPLEVFRGGVTGVYPHQVAEHGGSQVEIGLLPAVTHSWSLPFANTLLVEIRSDTTAHTQHMAGEGSRPRDRVPGAAAATRPPAVLNGKELLTLGRTTPGTAARATEVIGIAVEPLDDRTLVRVIGNGPILVYKTERPTHPAQFVLSLPALTTVLSGQSLDTSTPQLKQVAIRPADTAGATIEMTLASGVAPQIVRDGAQVVVELASGRSGNSGPKMPGGPRLMPVSTQTTLGAAMGGPMTVAQGTGTSPRTSEGAPIYTGQRISLDFQQADLIDVLRLIAEVSGMNIITGPDVTGRVTTRMANVPWDQALDMILKTFGLGKVQEGSIIRVAPLDRLRKERDDELQSKRVVEELEPPVTRTIQLNYARAEELKSNMEKLLTKQGRLDMDKRTNTIIVKDVSATVDEVLELIRRLDSQTKQVSIETRIVETSRTFLEELGIRWGGFVNQDTGVKFPRQVALTGRQPAPGGVIPTSPLGAPGSFGNFAVDLPTLTQPPSLAIGFSLISKSSVIDLELQALERTGRGRIISNPKVVTLDNKEAIIESGDEVPFKTESADTGPKVEFKDAKITLKVTPHISPDDYVLLEVDAAKKEVDFSRTVEGNPTIASRQSKTSVLVKNGATVVMGGLFKHQTTATQEGIPGLSKIPYLGWLFKNEQTRNDNEDLLFIITPRIVRERQETRNR